MWIAWSHSLPYWTFGLFSRLISGRSLFTIKPVWYEVKDVPFDISDFENEQLNMKFYFKILAGMMKDCLP